MFKQIVMLALLAGISFGGDIEEADKAFKNKDYTKAFQLFNKACENGDSKGCGVVGFFYETGQSVKKDVYQALSYYSKSCDMGNAYSCESQTKLQAKMPVCSEDEIAFTKDNRYFDVSDSDPFPSILADSKTISIDKKNKTIKVWTVWVASQAGRDFTIKDLGKYDNYENFGYTRSLDILNYASRTVKTKQVSNYDCNGGIIDSSNGDTQWKEITPGSVTEGILESIVKKYKLK